MVDSSPPRRPRTLGEALDRAVALGPDREALVAGDLRLSYRAVAGAVDALADQLRGLGLAPGERVALVLPNVPELAIAPFACARVGLVALPLHARSTATELRRRLAEVAVRAVLADRTSEPALRELRAPEGGPLPVLWRREDGVGFAGPGRPAAAPPITEDSPVLTQHSTGQGGAPKRVTRTHGQLLRETAAVSARLGIGPSDRILGAVPLFHAYGFVNALLCALVNGATLVLTEAADLLPRDLLRTLAAERVTGFPGVPFLFDALVAARAPASLDLRALRYGLSAGAPLSVATATTFRERFGAPVHQLYGTTETGVVAVNLDKGAPGSVGRPLDGVEVAIIDEAGHPVPPSREGDVAIRSEAMARAYDGPAAAGDSRFEGGAFLPGDVGFLDEAGRLVLTGRKRLFVNVGGQKVDPVEVEEVLRALEGVTDAAVVGVPDPIGGEQVKAAIVADAAVDRARILAHCRVHLAEHKVPRLIRFRAEIPRSPLGKVLRRALVDEEAGG